MLYWRLQALYNIGEPFTILFIYLYSTRRPVTRTLTVSPSPTLIICDAGSNWYSRIITHSLKHYRYEGDDRCAQVSVVTCTQLVVLSPGRWQCHLRRRWSSVTPAQTDTLASSLAGSSPLGSTSYKHKHTSPSFVYQTHCNLFNQKSLLRDFQFQHTVSIYDVATTQYKISK